MFSIFHMFKEIGHFVTLGKSFLFKVRRRRESQGLQCSCSVWRQTRRCKAYLRRRDALIISQIFRENLKHSCFYLNPNPDLTALVKGRDLCRSAILVQYDNVTYVIQNVASFIVYQSASFFLIFSLGVVAFCSSLRCLLSKEFYGHLRPCCSDSWS